MAISVLAESGAFPGLFGDTTFGRPAGYDASGAGTWTTGDLVLCYLVWYDNATPPGLTDFTKIRSTGSTACGGWYAKVAGGSEPASYTITGTGVYTVHSIVVRGAATPSADDSHSAGNTGSGTTRTGSAVTAGTSGALLLLGVSGYDSGSGAPSGMSEIDDDVDVNNAWYQESISSGSTGTRTATGTTSQWATVMLVLDEEGGGGGGVTGTGASSSPAQTTAIAGTVPRTGAVASVARAQTSALAGAVPRTGAAAAVAPAQTTAIAGLVPRTGSLGSVAPAQTSAIQGGLVATGTVGSVAPAQVAAISGIVPRTAAVASVAAPQTSALAGSVPRTATAASVAPAQVSAITGAGVTQGSVASVARGQATAIAGAVPRTGSVASVAPAQRASILTPITSVIAAFKDSSLWRRFGHHRR